MEIEDYPRECHQSIHVQFSLSPPEYYCNLKEQYVDENECQELCGVGEEE